MSDTEQKREVYVGNGQTIFADRLPQMKILDVKKALDLYLDNSDKDFSIGMQNDLFFTGTRIKSVMDIENYHCMASDWDTPIVEIDGEQIPCFQEIDEYLYSLAFNYGFYRGTAKIDFWFLNPKLSDTMRTLEYENMKAFVAEIQPIIEKYQPKRTNKGMYEINRPHTKRGKEVQEKLAKATDTGSATNHRTNTAAVERKPKATPTRDKGAQNE